MRVGEAECRGELVARAQRGPLSAAERSALRAHLASCDSCRLTQQVASDFAEMRAVERGDESRLERMSALARRAASGGGGPVRRRGLPARLRAAAVAAGVVLVAGTASATVWLLPLLSRPAPAPPASASPRRIETIASSATRRGAALEVAPPPPPVIVTPAPGLAPPEAVAVRAAAAGTPVRARARASAAALLREARAATTGGRGAEAVALYRKLQRDFPASTEAVVSAVPLGRLLLERASPQAALTEFNRYLRDDVGKDLRYDLRAARAGALVPEALYGRAQALARLGDREQERATWRRLVADFPDSPYSALARRRLTERQ